MSEKKINGAKSEADWWKWFRRSLKHFYITELTEEQQQLVNALAENMQVKPITAAIKVARLTRDFDFHNTEDGFIIEHYPMPGQPWPPA